MGEEDKLAREGSEERRIMGSRRQPLIFLSAGGDRVGRPPGQDGGEVEVLQRSVKVAAAHTSRGRFIPHEDARRQHVRQSVCTVPAQKKTKHPLMVCLWVFFFLNIVIYMCLIYAAHVQEHTCAHA